MKTDYHILLERVVKDYPFLWEAPLPLISAAEYFKAFRIKDFSSYYYVGNFNTSLFTALKDKLIGCGSYCNQNGQILFGCSFQYRKDIYLWGSLINSPSKEVVYVLDVYCAENKDFPEVFNYVKNFEYKEQAAFGFMPTK